MCSTLLSGLRCFDVIRYLAQFYLLFLQSVISFLLFLVLPVLTFLVSVQRQSSGFLVCLVCFAIIVSFFWLSPYFILADCL